MGTAKKKCCTTVATDTLIPISLVCKCLYVVKRGRMGLAQVGEAEEKEGEGEKIMAHVYVYIVPFL